MAHTIAVFIVGLVITLFEAFVGVSLWRWFVVPLGLPAISMAHYVGLNVAISLFVYRYIHEPADVRAEKRMATWVLVVLGCYVIGAVARGLL